MSKSTEDWYQLDFAVSRSLRYASKRRAFFERCTQITRAVVAIGGGGTVATVFQDGSLAASIFAGVVGIAAAIDLVFEFPRRAMAYDHLYRCYADLGIEIAKSDRDDKNYRLLFAKKLEIEKDEPTTLSVLNVICSNEELQSRGYDYTHQVNWWQGHFAQFGDFGQQKFEIVHQTNSLKALPSDKTSIH